MYNSLIIWNVLADKRNHGLKEVIYFKGFTVNYSKVCRQEYFLFCNLSLMNLLFIDFMDFTFAVGK